MKRTLSNGSKNTCFVTILLLLSVITACKKQINTDKESQNCQVTEIIYPPSSLGSMAYKVTYTGEKITRSELKVGASMEEITTYEYEANKITKHSEYSDGGKYTYVYTLDNKNRVISAVRTMPTDFKATGIYEYNSLGQLSQITTQIGSTTFDYTLTYVDGNLLSFGNRNFTYNSLEEYQEVLGHTHPLVIDNDALEELGDYVLVTQGYFGAQPKNLIKSHLQDIITYQKDGDGKIVGILTKRASSTSPEVITFKKFCK